MNWLPADKDKIIGGEEFKSCQISLDDLEKWALEHYEKISGGACDWMSVIPRAIRFYYATLKEAEKELPRL